jgi:alanine-glyoxylate transaminase / serine-glyoxylate transaminase / serine-pyruvate transaminase
MSRSSGRHFLQIPGPTNTPLSILAAIAKPTIDHRGPEFAGLGLDVLKRIRSVFKTEGPVIIYPTSGTGAWEAALVNTHSPGDRVLMFETGWFSTLWSKMATALDLRPEIIPGDWRSGARAEQIAEKLLADREHAYKAVAVVHNETSTGVKSNIEAVRRAIDDAKHPALLLVDTISSLGSMDYRHDEWGVDVTVCGSQKGLMLPPGLGFNAVSAKALEVAKTARLTRSFLGWDDMLASNAQGFFPYTPSTNLLQGLKVALDLIEAEGLTGIFTRHDHAALATRRAVQRWGFEIQCRNEAEYSSSLTAVRLPQRHSADALRRQILQDANLSLGNGLGPLADRVFRIGHLGDFSDASVLGTLAAIEMGLKAQGVPFGDGAIEAAIEVLSDRRLVMAEAAE